MRTPSQICTLAVLASATLFSGTAAADFVINDDLIVQGSTCVGLDCVNNESFGFDTLILKENNLRIFFNDTSVAAGFPANKWRITVNDSASGGASFFALDDVTGNRAGVFKVMAGAPSASLFVASSGNVGIGTTVPVLDLSLFSGDTPAIRLEQSGSQGFVGQTWDVAGNDANFFVRDVTGGSRLPFRIRPGAPTSSIDIAASGNVGIGTTAPGFKLDVSGSLDIVRAQGTSGNAFFRATTTGSTGDFSFGADNGSGAGNNAFVLFDRVNSAYRLVVNNSGNVGIGTTSPAAHLHTVGTVRFAGVANCGAGIQSNANGDLSCIVSSRQFKNIAGDLKPNVALANVMALRPQTGSYKETPDVPEHWLIAEEAAAVDPALVGHRDGQPYVVKTQNVVADLVAVVQQQQQQIEELKRLIAAK
jgi:hypothetical protein